MADADVEQVLFVDDVVLQRLALHLLHGAVVVIVGDEVPTRERELPLAGFLIRVSVRAKHGRAVADEHSTLRPGVRRGDEQRSDGGDGNDRKAKQNTHNRF